MTTGARPTMRVFIEFMPALGDLVIQLPILHALHRRVPDLDVEVSVGGGVAGLLDDYEWLGRVHARGGTLGSRMGPVASSFREPFDLLLYLRSNPTIKLTRLLVRARRKLGAEAYRPSWPDESAVTQRYSILEHVLEAPLPALDTRIRLQPSRRVEAMQAAGVAEGARILCIGPGASSAAKRWSPERFAELGRALGRGYDATLVLGSPDEAGLCRFVADACGGRSVAGTPLPVVAALLEQASLYVGNDSGLSHLAGAQGCPAVSLGLAVDYYRPWGGIRIPGALDELTPDAVVERLRHEELID